MRKIVTKRYCIFVFGGLYLFFMLVLCYCRLLLDIIWRQSELPDTLISAAAVTDEVRVDLRIVTLLLCRP